MLKENIYQELVSVAATNVNHIYPKARDQNEYKFTVR